MTIWRPPNSNTTLRSRRTKGKATYLVGKQRKFSDITKEWIELIPKTINENGCWIPDLVASGSGYVDISIEGKLYKLHRIVICLYYNIEYNNIKIVSRHNERCDKRCFFHEHLKSGTDSENVIDNVIRGIHKESQKKVCPKCNGPYKTTVTQTGWTKGAVTRHCPACKEKRRLERRRIAI